MAELYIGLISGTSADGVDAALVDLSGTKPKLLATHFSRYPNELRLAILDLYQPGIDEINRAGELDILVGKQFAQATNNLIKLSQIPSSNIKAIGSHGQTVRHHPQKVNPFTLQIGDPNVIAVETGITTIADFRRRDIAMGGQGAPLVPAFHHHIFSSNKSDRVIINIGGIANITLLPANNHGPIIGYDTGPGNALLDAMAEKYLSQTHDDAGKWSQQGDTHHQLLDNLLNDPYFARPFPKSTGREYFHLEWLQQYLPDSIEPVDIQATLVELTAHSIINAIQQHFKTAEIFVCGGGVRNHYLVSRLKEIGSNYSIESTQTFGIDPDWVEAMAFAWLAKQTLHKKTGNITSVTGAKKTTILGGVYFC